MKDEIEIETSEWYKTYYRRHGALRNDPRFNRGVIFQTIGLEYSLLRAMYKINHDPAKARVLDVGCGSGSDLYNLFHLGYQPVNIVGIDVQSDRLEKAKNTFPSVDFRQEDARRMGFESSSFDLVFDSTLFATLIDDETRRSIAGQMLRVCKSDGYIVLVEWRTPKVWDKSYKALTRSELRNLFCVGSACVLESISKGALIPPVGRFLSRYLPGTYFLTASLFPFLVGQVTYVLRRLM